MQQKNNFSSYVANLYQEFTAHDAQLTDRLKRYRNIETESAQFLAILIQTQQSKHVLEIGTSTGYSTLWLAQALDQTQGQMTTLEIDAERSAQAQQHAKNLILDHLVDYQVGDALDFLKKNDKVFDFVLLDAERDAYVNYWQYLQKLLNPQNGLLVVDNVLSHADQVVDFIKQVNDDSRFVTSTLNIGAGLLLIRYR